MQKSPKTTGLYLLKINHSDPQKCSVQVRNDVFDLVAQPLLSDDTALAAIPHQFGADFSLSGAIQEMPFGKLIHLQP